MRVIVTGSRYWQDYELIREVLSRLPKGSTIVHGAARGADSLADLAAKELGLLTEPHPAEWERYGKAAGIIRNQEMVNSGADLVLAFNDFLTNSPGTLDCVKKARKAGIQVILVHH